MFVFFMTLAYCTVPPALPKIVADAIALPILRAGIRENMQTAWDAYKATEDRTRRTTLGAYLLAANEALREVREGTSIRLNKGRSRVLRPGDARRKAPEVLFKPYNRRKSAKWNRENREYKVVRWDDPNAVQAGSLVRMSLAEATVSLHRSGALIFYVVVPKDGGKAFLIQMPPNSQLPDDTFSLTVLGEVVYGEHQFPGYDFDRAIKPLRLSVQYYTGEMLEPGTTTSYGWNSIEGATSSSEKNIVPVRETSASTLVFIEH